jgi:MFS family permease
MLHEAPHQPVYLTLDEALEYNSVGVFQYRLLLMCGFAFMADGLEVNLLSFLSTCAGEEWNLSNQDRAAITGVVFAGILAGSLFWGIFADRFGRKLTFLLACGLISAFGFLSGAAPNFAILITFRAIVGFGIGGANVPFDLLAEFLPSTHRGLFLIYIEYFWTIGSLFVSGLAWASLSQQGWQFLTVMTAIPVTATSIFSIIYLPESPRWLLVKGRRVEAEKIVREAAAVNGVTMVNDTIFP